MAAREDRDDTLVLDETGASQPGWIDAPSSGSRVVTPRGEIDIHTAPALRLTIAEALADPAVDRLVVDLSQTTFLDSSALGVLIGALKRMREREGRLGIVEPPSSIRRIFEITALDRVLDLHPDRDAALGA